MSRWVDIRVVGDDFHPAFRALLSFAPFNMAVNCCPPAAGPEMQISLEGVGEGDVRACLDRANVRILAVRTRLDQPLEAQMGLANKEQ